MWYSSNKWGCLLYSDCALQTVNKVVNGLIEKLIKVRGWIPANLHVTSSGDLLVVMSDEAKLHNKVVSIEKQTIQFKEDGKPLYSREYKIKYITENRNLDICVADRSAGAVVVVSQVGNSDSVTPAISPSQRRNSLFLVASQQTLKVRFWQQTVAVTVSTFWIRMDSFCVTLITWCSMILTVCVSMNLTCCMLPSTTLEISRSSDIISERQINSWCSPWLMRKINWIRVIGSVHRFLSDWFNMLFLALICMLCNENYLKPWLIFKCSLLWF